MARQRIELRPEEAAELSRQSQEACAGVASDQRFVQSIRVRARLAYDSLASGVAGRRNQR
jgi:hypothetical protein